MLSNEFEIVRAVSVKLDDSHIFTLSYQYHTEKDPDDPAGRRNNRANSRYRMMGRVESISEMEKKVFDLYNPDQRLQPWKWPDDPTWDGNILYMKDADNSGRSNWIRLKIKKALKWEDYLQVVKGYKKDTNKRSKTFGKYVVFTPNAVYETEGYTAGSETIDITDREALLRHAGENVWKEIRMKLVGPANMKKPEAKAQNKTGTDEDYTGVSSFGLG